MLYLTCENCRHYAKKTSTCWETGHRTTPRSGCTQVHSAQYRACLYTPVMDEAPLAAQPQAEQENTQD